MIIKINEEYIDSEKIQHITPIQLHYGAPNDSKHDYSFKVFMVNEHKPIQVYAIIYGKSTEEIEKEYENLQKNRARLIYEWMKTHKFHEILELKPLK